MKVAKWHGLGNDYLVVEDSDLPGELTPSIVRVLCDRHLGIGSDGILVHCRPSGAVQDAVARMRVFNPDGSESEMCGNGMRIFALYLRSLGLVGAGEFTVETLAGPIKPSLVADDQVRVDMGIARFRTGNISAAAGAGDVVDAVLESKGREYRFTFVDVGNPHCVIQVVDPTAVDVAEIGPRIETHPFFPNRTNVEFIAVRPGASVEMRVWERGVGETQACGTGATAVGAACVRLGLVKSPVVVRLLGGELLIEAEACCEGPEPGSLHMYMSGPAEKVFSAEASADLLHRVGWRQ
jgi:diaminopimelate epimerase